MLVLTRKVGESIIVGHIMVHIGRITNGRVRIAIEAPSDVSILRGELAYPEEDDFREKPVEWGVLAARQAT